MNEDAALTGVVGVVASLRDVGAARSLGERLAADQGVGAVAVHTDDADPAWALVRATGGGDVLAEVCRSVPGAAVSTMRSRRLRRHRVRWSAGAPTPGVSMVFDVRRNADLSAEQFHRHWRDIHGPKALQHHLGMWDYDQLSVIDGDFDLDGIAVVGFPAGDDARARFFDTDDGADIIRADAAFFTDSATLGRRLTTEWVLKDDEDPLAGDASRQDWSDHRSLELPTAPDVVWAVLGDFGAILDWWPRGLETSRLDPGPPPSRTLGRPDGTAVTESLVHHRPQERMFQLAVTAGFPDAVADYTCRYEVRDTGDGCRLDWSPRASVAVGAEGVFGDIVDTGWDLVVDGLTSAVG